MKKNRLGKLETLTTKNNNGRVATVWLDKTIPCGLTSWCPSNPSECENQCDFGAIINRLSAYEDTRLIPDGIENLKRDVKKYKGRAKKLEYALLLMIDQYCNESDGTISNRFMSAGEHAFEALGIDGCCVNEEEIKKRIAKCEKELVK